MLREHLRKYNIILASKSPRRQFLLKELGLDFEIRPKEVDESFPKKLKGKQTMPFGRQVALYLCKKKAEAFRSKLKPNDLLITADTIVWINGKVLNKPAGYSEAVKMLKLLSGKMHTVFTGVSLTTSEKQKKFCCETKVFFKKLSHKEIDFYVTSCRPYDKAGAYGAQEWIGYVGVKKIIGSYFNVMGLPIKETYEALMKF